MIITHCEVYFECYRGGVSSGINISVRSDWWTSRMQLWTKCGTASQPATSCARAGLTKSSDAGVKGKF